ncbi:leucine-rich repeat, cysteine-containing subtype protein [Tanacetum coccineum]
MKELVLANCTKLTDKAVRAISKSCPGLCAIDLTNVCKLTDKSLAHLANGCPKIQILKFCRNTFSDEAVAAYLEACGAPLRELSLNHVNKVYLLALFAVLHYLFRLPTSQLYHLPNMQEI